MSYANVDGLNTYYETHGTGDPLVLLHGGLATADTWAGQVPELAKQYQVIVPERRGHGRTADADGRYTYRLMAAETARLLDVLGVSSAHLVGWSDGALVAALVAIDRPELVEKLVLIGQYFQPDGAHPAVAAMLADTAAMTAWARESYDALSPDGPAHFDVVVEKILRMWREDTGIPLDELATITAPTLVMQGDGDFVTVEHSALIRRTLAEAQLAVVPGTSHGLPMEKPALVNELILEFLGGEHSAQLIPLEG
ncbi:alpha/beta fold hydrolase [Cryptosporangium phraense]|uniref:Alpha/beta hydrolase n=1 Tax=Cryptosporangium phraense TaxID=2593070 RepID=A0A545AEG1_9ACTN|nr:alpha/beta hydrolase [Cryptosporangium phraense]TQS39721.1 alpha/beta hydrolase [Cryptosporangium phraense]